jgi:hypothetical protein
MSQPETGALIAEYTLQGNVNRLMEQCALAGTKAIATCMWR